MIIADTDDGWSPYDLALAEARAYRLLLLHLCNEENEAAELSERFIARSRLST